MSDKVTITIRVPKSVYADLKATADANVRSMNWVAVEALYAYFDTPAVAKPAKKARFKQAYKIGATRSKR